MGVADVNLQPSSNLPSTTLLQSTQTSAAVEPTTISTKTFPNSGVEFHFEQNDIAGDVTLRLAGPSDVWFGIGFNALTMSERPYAVIVDGSTCSTESFQERRLGRYGAGDPLGRSLLLLSPPSSINGKCHVEFRRSLAGQSPFHFSFSPAASSLNLIAAKGSSSSFGFHAARDAGVMPLVRE